MSDWTIFSNHGHVLVCLARDPGARLRDVAAAVGITERAVQKIVRDLQEGGMLSVSKQGRRNQYRLHRKVGLRHSLESERNIGGLIDFVCGDSKPAKQAKRQSDAKAVVKKVAPSPKVAEKPVIKETPDLAVKSAAIEKSAVVEKPIAVEKPAVVQTPVVAENPVVVETPVVAEPSKANAKPAGIEAVDIKTEPAKPVVKKKAPQEEELISDIEKQQGSLF